MSVDKRNLEDLLEKGLTKYGKVASRPGLENRVLAHLRAESERGGVRFWQRWSFRLGAIVVGAALALLIVWRPNAKLPEMAHTVSRIEPEAPRVFVPPPRPDNSRRALPPKTRRPIVPVVAAHPRPEQFPSARPLSSQETLLLAYVNHAPFGEVAAAAGRARRTEEIHVQNLEVAPLDVDRPSTVTEQK